MPDPLPFTLHSLIKNLILIDVSIFILAFNELPIPPPIIPPLPSLLPIISPVCVHFTI